MDRPKAVTFDLYGTLVRFHEAVEATLTEILAELDAGHVDMQDLRARFRATQGPLQQSGTWRPYKEILRRGLETAMGEFGLPGRPAFGDRLVAAIAAAGPFPEVPEALAAIRGKAKLVLISNTDNDMIAGNLARLGVAPDLAVTAEEARAYKPAPAIFRHAFERAGVRPEEVIHVAASFHHDIEPAHALGLRRVWINRRQEVGDARFGPYVELPDLAGLPAILGF